MKHLPRILVWIKQINWITYSSDHRKRRSFQNSSSQSEERSIWLLWLLAYASYTSIHNIYCLICYQNNPSESLPLKLAAFISSCSPNVIDLYVMSLLTKAKSCFSCLTVADPIGCICLGFAPKYPLEVWCRGLAIRQVALLTQTADSTSALMLIFSARGPVKF